MSAQTHCARCHAQLSELSDGDVCAACLFALGLETADSFSEPPQHQAFPTSYPEHIGPYRIVETLGEGGMGVVYLAEQEAPLRRRVAVKVIKLGMDTNRVVARFEAERQTLALMQHPNIAAVFDAGSTADGRPYFCMEYVPGLAITEYCDREKLPITARLTLFAQVCDATQHAHQKGIIHRDLKPSNVLVTIADGRPVPKIIDFGIAKATGQSTAEESQFTEHGLLIGTPEYMSPEQAEAVDIDARTDIYSLGVLLYELLVGAVPFDRIRLRRAGYAEIQRIIREEEPLRPSTHLTSAEASAQAVANRRNTDVRALARLLRGDLDWIALRALEKERSRRYASASEFGSDVVRYLSNEPIAARAPSVSYRVRKFVARHRVPVVASAALFFAVLAGFATSTSLYFRAEHARRESDSQRDIAERERRVAQAANQEAVRQRESAVSEQRRAEAARVEAVAQRASAERHLDEAQRLEYASHIQAASLSITGGLVREAARQLDLCEPRLRGWEWRHLMLAADPSAGSLQLPSSGEVGSSLRRVDRLTFESTRSGLIALGLGWRETIHGMVRFQNAVEGPKLESLVPPESIIAVNPNGNRAVVAHWEMRWIFPPDRPVATTRLEGDENTGRYVIRAIDDIGDEKRNQLTVIDTRSRAAIAKLTFPDAGVWRSPVHLTEAPVPVFRSAGPVSQVLSSPSDSRPLSRLLYGRVVSAAMNADGSLVAAWSWDHVIRVWNAVSGALPAQLRGHKDLVAAVAFTDDGKQLVSGSYDGSVRVWDISTEAQVASLEGPRTPVTAIARHDRSSVSAAGTEDGAIWLWVGDNRMGAQMTSKHEGAVTALAFSPDAAFLASVSRDRTLRVWDLSTRTALRVFKGHPSQFNAVTFSPSGWIASAGNEPIVRLWNLRSRPHDLVLNGDDLMALAFGPDGGTLLTYNGAAIKTREMSSGRVLSTLEVGGQAYLAAAYPRGNRIAVAVGGRGSPDDTSSVSVQIRDARTSEVITSLRCPHTLVSQMAFDSSGRLLATAAKTRTSMTSAVHVWDVRTGRLLAETELTTMYPINLAFSSDGQRIATDSSPSLVIWEWGLKKRPVTVRVGDALAMRYLPDDRIMVGTASKVELRDGRSGALVGELVGHDGPVSAVASDRAGTRIFTAGPDGTLRIWDTTTRALLLTLPAPRLVNSLLVSEDGRSVAAQGGGIRVWHSALPRQEDALKAFFGVR